MFIDQLESKVNSWREDQTTLVATPLTQESISRAEAFAIVQKLTDHLAAQNNSRPLVIGLNFEAPKNWILASVATQLSKSVVVPIPMEFTDEQIASFTPNLDLILTDSEKVLERFNSHTKFQKVAGTNFLSVEASRQADLELPGDAVGVIHTSGSTATPKGVVISENGLSTVIESMRQRLVAIGPIHYASILPYSLLLEQILGIYLPVLTGGTISVLPTVISSYTGTQSDLDPYLNSIRLSGANFSMLPPSFLADLQRRSEKGGRSPREALGRRLNVIATGGAPIDMGCLEYFRANQVEIFQGYGLSENTSVVAWNYPGPNTLGSVGSTLSHNLVRIGPEGRVEVSGPSVFLGYVTHGKFRPRITEWLDTGDNGYFDDNGVLYITGRDNNLIVLSSGRNVAPEWVENKFKTVPGIKDFVVVGHGRPYLSALVFVDRGANQHDALESVTKRASDVADELPEFARIGAFQAVAFDNEFYSVSGRILRSKVLEACAELIAATYQHPGARGETCKTLSS